jgi:hypothetical protein
MLYKKYGAVTTCSNTHHTEELHATEEESNHFAELVKVKVTGKDPCDIINMD